MTWLAFAEPLGLVLVLTLFDKGSLESTLFILSSSLQPDTGKALSLDNRLHKHHGTPWLKTSFSLPTSPSLSSLGRCSRPLSWSLS